MAKELVKLSNMKTGAISPDKVFLVDHATIDATKAILLENSGGYIPGHERIAVNPNLQKRLQADLSRVVEDTGYVIAIDVLEILYETERDQIVIQHNPNANTQEVNKQLAVGQATMILISSGVKSAHALLSWDQTQDKIIIENASQLVTKSLE